MIRFVLSPVPVGRVGPARRDGAAAAEESSVVDGAEGEEVGDAVEVLEAAAALAALARRRSLVRLDLFRSVRVVGRGGRDLQVVYIYRDRLKVGAPGCMNAAGKLRQEW